MGLLSLSVLLMTLLMAVSGLLIFIVLLQRGRGGGLAGAFGGLGGQSAFGTKAGDVFTKITVVLAVIWVVLAGANGFALRADANRRYTGGEEAVPEGPAVSQGEQDAQDNKDEKPADGGPAPSGGNTEEPAGLEKPQPDKPTGPTLKKSDASSGEKADTSKSNTTTKEAVKKKADSTKKKNDANDSAGNGDDKKKSD